MTVSVNKAAGWRLSLFSNLSAAADAQARLLRSPAYGGDAHLFAANMRHVPQARHRFFDYLIKFIAVNGHRHPDMAHYLLRPELATCLVALDTTVDAEANLLTSSINMIERRLQFYDALHTQKPAADPLYSDECADRFELFLETISALDTRNSPIFDMIKYVDETNISETFSMTLDAPDRSAADIFGPRYIKGPGCALTETANVMNRIECQLNSEADPLSWMDELRRVKRIGTSFSKGADMVSLKIRTRSTGTCIKAVWCTAQNDEQQDRTVTARGSDTKRVSGGMLLPLPSMSVRYSIPAPVSASLRVF